MSQPQKQTFLGSTLQYYPLQPQYSPSTPIQTATANIPFPHVNILPIPDIDQSIPPSNAHGTSSYVSQHNHVQVQTTKMSPAPS